MQNAEIINKGIKNKKTLNYSGKNVSTHYNKELNILYIKSYNKIIGIVDYENKVIYKNIHSYSNTTARHKSSVFERGFKLVDYYTDAWFYREPEKKELYTNTINWYNVEIEKIEKYKPIKEHTKEAKKEKLKGLKENLEFIKSNKEVVLNFFK